MLDRLRATTARVAPGHPSPIVPIVVGDEELPSRRQRPARPSASSCPPSARRRSPPGPPVFASPSRRPTPTRWSIRCSAVSCADRAATMTSVPTGSWSWSGTGTEVGKTWSCPHRSLRHLRSAGHAVRARKPVQSFDPESAEPRSTPSVLAAATGEHADDICTPAPVLPGGDGTAHGGRGPRDVPHRRRWTSSGSSRGPASHRRRPGRGGRRRPVPAGDRWGQQRSEPARWTRTWCCSSPTPDSGRHRLLPLAAPRHCAPTGGVVVYLNRFRADDDLHVRNLAWLRDRDGIDAITEWACSLTGSWADRPTTAGSSARVRGSSPVVTGANLIQRQIRERHHSTPSAADHRVPVHPHGRAGAVGLPHRAARADRAWASGAATAP